MLMGGIFRHNLRRDGGQSVSALNSVQFDMGPRAAPLYLAVARMQHCAFDFNFFVQMQSLLIGRCRKGSGAKQ